MAASTVALIIAGLALLVWLALLLGRDGFWRATPRIEALAPPAPAPWPEVVALVPARNEAPTIEAALRSLLAQDYPGTLRIVVVDDHSEDATPAIARRLAAGAARPLEVLAAAPLPGGWSGKLWALECGRRHAAAVAPAAPWLWLGDADIAHDPSSLRRLVALAEADARDLVSLMVRLRCQSFWERLLIPAFVFFFQKLYPFPAVNDPDRRLAAAAGGCALVRRGALEADGGFAAIRGALIDDVALARRIKGAGGRIWLGHAGTSRSLRAYDRLGPIWAMVVRTADTQLRHSLLLLAVTGIGMGLAYLAPPLVLLAAPWHQGLPAALLALAAWLLMAGAYRPTARLYGLGPGWWPGLPLAAVLFVAMTVDSALQHRRGRGGAWKGRIAGCDAATGGRDSLAR